MPICKVCNNKWNWKQTVKQTMTSKNAISCPYCKEKQYVSKKSIKNQSFLRLIILLPLLMQPFFDLPGAVFLSLFPVLSVIVFLLNPFLFVLISKYVFSLNYLINFS